MNEGTFLLLGATGIIVLCIVALSTSFYTNGALEQLSLRVNGAECAAYQPYGDPPVFNPEQE
jgi:hypothetical protein